MAEQVAIATKYPEVITQIESLAFKQFDGDYNVLVKDIIQINKVKSVINLPEVAQALNDLKGIGSENYYPQVYVPRLLNRNQLQVGPTTLDVGGEKENIEFVLYDGNEEVIELPAWELDDNDVLVQNGTLVDEIYLIENPVWVISLNESVDFDGYLPIDETIRTMDHTPPPPPVDPTNINLKISKIGISCLKESVFAGKADVSIRGFRYTWNGKMDGQPNGAVGDYSADASTSDLRGKLIRRFSKDEMWNGVDLQRISVNFNLHKNWRIFNWNADPIVFGFVIFEKDNWPAKPKTDAIYPFPAHFPTVQRFLIYRSSHTSYISGSFYVSKAGWPANFIAPIIDYYPDNTIKEQIFSNSCIYYNVMQY